MGYRNSRRVRKFYGEQVEAIRALLVRYVESKSDLDLDKYLRICEQLGQVPDPEKMPLDTSDFPYDVQVAFFIYNQLADNWEGMSGTYMGKDWTNLKYLFELYEIEDKKTIFLIMQMYDNIVAKKRADDQSEKRKEAERKSKSKSGGGGKNYVHRVQG